VRDLAERTGILRRFSDCFDDYRDPELIEHTVLDLVSQRVLGLIQGYEDLNDHDDLRDDALLACAVGKADPVGETRPRLRDRGHALAGKSTLNRLELTPVLSPAFYRPGFLGLNRVGGFGFDRLLSLLSGGVGKRERDVRGVLGYRGATGVCSRITGVGLKVPA